MRYSLIATEEALNDVERMAAYMVTEFKNHDAAFRFLDTYEQEANALVSFPFGYRGVSFEYRGYEIRMKAFETYNMFFAVDMEHSQITILRVLKDRQDWNEILKLQSEYHF